MGERDAFGNEKGEDPLGTMGWSASESAPPETLGQDSATATSAASEAGLATAPPSPHRPAPVTRRSSRHPSRRRGTGTAISATILVAATVGVCAGAIALFAGSSSQTGDDLLDRITPDGSPESSQSPPRTAPNVTARPVATPPRGLGRGSLLRPAAFGATLARLRNGHHGRVLLLRLTPDRIDTTFSTPAGSQRLVRLQWNDEPAVIRSSPTSAGRTPTFTVESIDRGAPARLVRAAAARSHLTPSAVDYLVLLPIAGQQQWGAYFRGGAIAYLADAHGRITRRIS